MKFHGKHTANEKTNALSPKALPLLRDALDASTFDAVLSVMRGEARVAIERERGLIGLLMLSERDPRDHRDRLALFEAALKKLETA